MSEPPRSSLPQIRAVQAELDSRRARIFYHAARWIWVPGLALVAVFAYPGGFARDVPVYAVGDIPERDLIAPRGVTVRKSDSDLALEAEARAASVKPTYEYRRQPYDSALSIVQLFFGAVEDAGEDRDSIRQVSGVFSIDVTAAEAGFLADVPNRNALQAALGRHLGATLATGVAGAGVLSAETAREVILLRGRSVEAVLRDSILSYQDYLRAAGDADIGPSPTARGLFMKMVQGVFRPTILFNGSETERRRDELRRTVDPVKYVVRAGERIVTAHEPVTQEAVERVEALRSDITAERGTSLLLLRNVFGPTVIFTFVLGVFWVFLLVYRPEIYADRRQVELFGMLFAFAVLAGALVATYIPNRPELIPLPLVAMLVGALFGGRISMVAAMIIAVAISSHAVFRSTPSLPLMLLPAVVAAMSMRVLRRRNQIFSSVGAVAASFAVVAIAVGITDDWSLGAIGLSALAGSVNTVISAALTLLVLPAAESFTRVTTDYTLLELSDPSRRLLRRLATEAPGTYAHSMAMANLCERAANAIGANGLLARVGCYYHDIGKLDQPQFFVENQKGVNPHDRLSPEASAKIIKDHVRAGMELAKEHRLPVPVCQFIPEHHGTMPITYFLARAREQGGEPKDPSVFQYPGPRPRTQETAITMLADSVEAALRVLTDPSPDRVREAVEHIVKTKTEQGQLTEAPITLGDINCIVDEFVAVLGGLHHNRIDYPEEEGGISSSWEPGESGRDT